MSRKSATLKMVRAFQVSGMLAATLVCLVMFGHYTLGLVVCGIGFLAISVLAFYDTH